MERLTNEELKARTTTSLKLIWTISLALVVCVNGIMFGWKYARRAAEDIKIMNSSEAEVVCERMGGKYYYDGGCKKE